ncbi:unnamed protein product [Scytosiphon promiscuus]
MRYTRLHAGFVILGVLRLASVSEGLVVTGAHSRLMRHRRAANAATSASCSQQHRGSRAPITMGAAGKKRKKLEKDALKYADGINKNVAREAQKEADIIAQRLLKACAEPKRDLDKITADIVDLRSRTSALKPAQSYDLSRDWRLVFASDDDAISVVGTGLHKLPLTRMQDFFMTLSGSSTTVRQIVAIEVLRVIGPFPNLRNTLSGDCKSTGTDSLNIRYSSMIDGTGKETGGSQTGEQDRVVDVDVAFVGQGALVLQSSAAKSKKAASLVFAREPDLDGELAKLRVADKSKDEK